jgi:hypothetical protein
MIGPKPILATGQPKRVNERSWLELLWRKRGENQLC